MRQSSLLRIGGSTADIYLFAIFFLRSRVANGGKFRGKDSRARQDENGHYWEEMLSL
jgi:hypothetical protein